MSTIHRPPNFDNLARFYRWMEKVTFGQSLWHCRCRFLDELRDCRNALALGDGDGRFTARLLQQNPVIQIEAVDASSAMLRTLQHNAGIHRDRVRTHQADARQWEPGNAAYELIVTHFFLDCLTTEEVATLAEHLRSCTTDRTKWVVSEFAIPQGWFGKLVGWPLVKSLYLSFKLLTGLRPNRLPRHRDALSNAGFVLDRKSTALGGLLLSEIWVPGPRNEAESGSTSPLLGELAPQIVPRGTIVIRDTYDQFGRNLTDDIFRKRAQSFVL
jgi:ubiquinone/menaquinone biosynthesis C-methylase UbiE